MSDFIERSKAIQAIYWNVMECNNIEMAESVLKDVPSVDVVPTEFHDKCLQIEIQKRFNAEKHGHWETIWKAYECSVCGEISINNYYYCPHCGAKMDEVTE